MAYIDLANVPVGSLVSIQESAGYANYIVLQHDWGAAGRTLLMRQYLAGKCHWSGESISSVRNSYIGGELQITLNNYPSTNMPAAGTGNSIAGYIPLVSIDVRDVNRNFSSIAQRCFAPGIKELGMTSENQNYPGTRIPYFSMNDKDPKRVATASSGGSKQVWWTRDADWVAIVRAALQVGTDGGYDDAVQYEPYHYRPFFCLPDNITVDYDSASGDNKVYPNVRPVIAGSVSVSQNPIRPWEGPFTVSWPAATDPGDASLAYVVQKSYDRGLTWQDVAPSWVGTSIALSLPNGETTRVKFRVAARDAYVQSVKWIESGNISVLKNTAPTAPATIGVSTPLKQGGPVAVNWSASTDAENNLDGYILEQSTDSGATWTQIYEGADRSWNGTLGSWATVRYRVKAYDSYGAESAYKASSNLPVVVPVAITVKQNASSGIKNSQPPYTTDAARTVMFTVANTVDPGMTAKYTTDLKRDDVLLERKTAVISGGTYTLSLTKKDWQLILNGQHTYTLTVTDTEGNAGTAGITFTKDVSRILFRSGPIPVEISDGSDLRYFMLNVVGSFPAGSVRRMYVTREADKADPTWQEITEDQINSGKLEEISAGNGHVFAVRMEVNRGSAGAVRIDQISGQGGKNYLFTLSEDNEQLRTDFDTKALKLLGYVSNYASLPTSPDIRLPGGVWKTNDTGRYWCWTGDAWLEAFPQYDAAPAAGSTKGITSGAVHTAVAALNATIEANRLAAFKHKGSKPTFTALPGDPQINDVWETADTGDEWYWSGAAWKPFGPTIVADTVPTAGSTNLVTSGGVFSALEELRAQLTEAVARITELETVGGETAEAFILEEDNG